MNCTAWTPGIAGQYLTVSWDYVEGRVLLPGQVLAIQVELAVSQISPPFDNFSFDLNVYGFGV